MFLAGLTIAAALAAANATPSIVEVQLDVRFERAEPLPITVVAHRPETPTDAELSASSEVDSSGRAFLRLPSSGSWEITCLAPAVWCPRQTLEVSQAQLSSTLPVFRTATLKAAIETPRGKPRPEKLDLTLWLGDGEGREPLETQEQVAVVEGRVETRIPQAGFDLRIETTDWAPVYRWGVVPGQGNTLDLGTVQLTPGGALSGLVTDGEHARPFAGARIRLAPPAEQKLASREEQARLARHIFETTTDQRGRFTITPVPPGAYQLTADAPERARLRREPVTIQTGQETLFPDLRLAPKLALEVVVIPAQAPDGTPWNVALYSSESRNVAQKRSSAADERGSVRFSDLDAGGNHNVEVLDAAGSRLAMRTVSLETSEIVFIDLDLIAFEGQILLDGEPLVAELELILGQGDAIYVKSDVEGRFSGSIRKPPRSWVSMTIRSEKPFIVRRVDVVDPPVREGVLQLAIDLPDRAVKGRVIDDQGKPVADARVKLYSSPRSVVIISPTGAGTFEFRGLDARKHWLTAEHPSLGSSEALELEPASPAREATLVLRPGRPIRGRLQTHAARPVAGAELLFYFAAPAEAAYVRTSLDGGFTFLAPPAAALAVVQVSAHSEGMLWSACVQLPTEPSPAKPWTLELPPPPTTTLASTGKSSPDLPFILDAESAYLTSDGGFLEFERLGAWNWRRSVQAMLTDEPPRFSGLAAGRYAGIWNQEPHWLLAMRTCTGALPAALSWHVAPPGGSVEIELDSLPLQKAVVERARALRRE